MLGNVVADREQMARLVVEKTVFHLREFACLLRESFDGGDARLCETAGRRHVPPQAGQPLALLVRGIGARAFFDRRQPGRRVVGQFAQRGNHRGVERPLEPGRCCRQLLPGCERAQLVQRAAALARQRLRPPFRVDSRYRGRLVALEAARDFGGGMGEPGEPGLRSGNGGRPRIVRGFDILLQLGEPCRCGGRLLCSSFGKYPQRIAEAFEQADAEDGLIGHRQQARAQRQQMRRQIAAVDR